MMWLELLLSSLLLVLAFALIASVPPAPNPLLDFYKYQSLNDGLLALSAAGASDSSLMSQAPAHCADFFDASAYSDVSCEYTDRAQGGSSSNAFSDSDFAPLPSGRIRREASIGVYAGGRLQFLHVVSHE